MMTSGRLKSRSGFGFVTCMLFTSIVAADEPITPVSQRFAAATVDASTDEAEQPNFQRHVVPLLGRLGCNGRSCHGSFQGRGGLQLSLFGYDFEMDHASLTARAESERIRHRST